LLHYFFAWAFFAARAAGGAGLRPCAPPARAAVLQVSVLLKSVCGWRGTPHQPYAASPWRVRREAA